jgi:transposase
LLRCIEGFVELSNSRRELAPYYRAIGRPSIAPELMICMLLIGYCCSIRSERRLCKGHVYVDHLNLAYRWFCHLGLTDPVPDHSTFSKNRHGRFRDSDLLRRLFETTVRRCMAVDIVGGQGFAVDASMIRADAHRQKGVISREELDPKNTNRAVTRYLAVLDDAAFGAATEAVPRFISRPTWVR